MAQRKYTLPRHTNLANQGPRLGAFFIDLAIFVAITLGFLFGCFRFIFAAKINELSSKINEERIKSHLFYKENDEIKYYSVTADNEEFKNGIAYFYTVYIPEIDVNKDDPVELNDGTKVSKKEYFTVAWFNQNILDVEGEGAPFFTYVKIGDADDKSQIAQIKEDVTKENVNKFLQGKWRYANYDLNQLKYFKSLNNEYGFYGSLELVLSALIACSITYIVLPIILKNGSTAGKKAFGLCLADSDGYKIRNYQLLMRIIPLDVALLALLIPIWSSLLVVILVPLILLLVSFALAMSSPKRSSLHDFVAKTIVVNARTSILFTNAIDEETYIAKEDNIPIEIPTESGEEPEIKYEK